MFNPDWKLFLESGYRQRTADEIKERVVCLLVAALNDRTVFSEPENAIPHFVEAVAAQVTELCIDEINFGLR